MLLEVATLLIVVTVLHYSTGNVHNMSVDPCSSSTCGSTVNVFCEVNDPIRQVHQAVVYLSEYKTTIDTLHLNGSSVNTFIDLSPFHNFGNATIDSMQVVGQVKMWNVSGIEKAFWAQRRTLRFLSIGGSGWNFKGTLQRIPSKATKVLSHLEKLDLQQNQIRFIKLNDLDGLVELKELDLSENKIDVMDPRALQPVKDTLQTLVLGSNRINLIPAGFLDNLLNLTVLDISQNYLHVVRAEDFETLDRLRIIRLNSNSLFKLANDTFEKLVNLREVELSDNRIESIEAGTFHRRLSRLSVIALDHNEINRLEVGSFDALPALTSLYLGNNDIDELKDGVFNRLMNLEELYMGYNQIKNIGPHFFDRMMKLKKLELWNNRLIALDSSTFCVIWAQLDVLDVGSNYFKCDCSVEWIYKSLHSRMNQSAPNMLLMYCFNERLKKSLDMTTIKWTEIDCTSM